jgi:hypothetical protein
MTGGLVVLDGVAGDVSMEDESALAVSLQGSPAAPFRLTVRKPGCAQLLIVNNATDQPAFVACEGCNPATAHPLADTLLWIDSAGNGHNFS